MDTVCASVLHDTLEDTPLAPELLEDCFGADVVGIVNVLSKVPKEGGKGGNPAFDITRGLRDYLV